MKHTFSSKEALGAAGFCLAQLKTHQGASEQGPALTQSWMGRGSNLDHRALEEDSACPWHIILERQEVPA